MASTVRVQAPIGQRALFITTLAVPLTGWTVHALTLHRKLSAARRDPLRGLLGRDGFTAEAWQITDRDGDHALVGMVDLDHFKQINDGPGGVPLCLWSRETGVRWVGEAVSMAGWLICCGMTWSASSTRT
ncbi:hypothetical protein [Streptomyces sp. CL12-4]|uniref:hypothetical protein n=1 Tax=Streptomyces sp. CL12-4 TaxID=2810306 RepID=UPI001EFBCA82|nr:hypothetical protein [Streptomyces sp. CL12-4]MCG8970430.1 hypothetical protein [Streptomyces sp. CL12-4]